MDKQYGLSIVDINGEYVAGMHPLHSLDLVMDLMLHFAYPVFEGCVATIRGGCLGHDTLFFKLALVNDHEGCNHRWQTITRAQAADNA